MMTFILIIACGFANAEEVKFNRHFLRTAQDGEIDIHRFERANVVLPGSYVVQLYLNDEWIGRREVSFFQRQGQPSAMACFDDNLLRALKIDDAKLTAMALGAQGCHDIAERVPGAMAHFDSGEQRLDVTVPQAMLLHRIRGYVDPELWDDGVPAAIVNYNANMYRTNSSVGGGDTQSYLGLNGGVNFGPWRLRHQGTYTHDRLQGSRYQRTQTYVSRSVVPLRSVLTLGETSTGSQFFSGVSYRGLLLASEDRMMPQSQREFAPVVFGIANTAARVRVRQRDSILYETSVPPGPFEIRDLYPTGFGGDLVLEVTEADGRVLVSRIPYASAPGMLRAGAMRYQFALGQYHRRSINETPVFGLGTLSYGFNNTITGYGGILFARAYQAAMGGAVLNTPYGALATDVTGASSKPVNGGHGEIKGYSARLSYSKFLEPTSTNILLAGYRYSGKGYRDFEEALIDRQYNETGRAPFRGARKHRLNINLDQQLARGYGSVHISGSLEEYWDRAGRGMEYSASYANDFRSVSYMFSLKRQQELLSRRWENQVALTISLPLGWAGTQITASTNIQRTSNGQSSIQQNVNGFGGDAYQLSYGLNAAAYRSNDSSSTSQGANVGYVFPRATVNASVSQGRGYRQASASASGAVVAYGGGVVMSPTQGDTFAILEAPGAAGANVQNLNGMRLDGGGKALLPNVNPYEMNALSIDPQGLPLGVSFKSTEQRAVPTKGAVVLVPFASEDRGRTVVMVVRHEDGGVIPFGTQVFDRQGKSVGIVGQGSRAIVNGLDEERGALEIVDLGTPGTRCAFDYVLPKDAGDTRRLAVVEDLVCRRQADVSVTPGAIR